MTESTDHDPLEDPADRWDDDDFGSQMDRAYDATDYKNGADL